MSGLMHRLSHTRNSSFDRTPELHHTVPQPPAINTSSIATADSTSPSSANSLPGVRALFPGFKDSIASEGLLSLKNAIPSPAHSVFPSGGDPNQSVSPLDRSVQILSCCPLCTSLVSRICHCLESTLLKDSSHTTLPTGSDIEWAAIASLRVASRHVPHHATKVATHFPSDSSRFLIYRNSPFPPTWPIELRLVSAGNRSWHTVHVASRSMHSQRPLMIPHSSVSLSLPPSPVLDCHSQHPAGVYPPFCRPRSHLLPSAELLTTVAPA
ncbi:hypothetical protein BKA62DRAFT_321782 [Auriculariales sp. MPI-PUGE-AT-0066]|nr:hypothetical protein BKA62DRAFT_321782 [Auriculariales sp. MPI-PUGE-AT-0066]